MRFLLTMWYPPDKINDMASKFKIGKIPDFIKRWDIYGTSDGLNGFKSYQLITIEKGKVDEGVDYLIKELAQYTEIEGHRWKIEPVLGIKDSFRLFGLKTN